MGGEILFSGAAPSPSRATLAEAKGSWELALPAPPTAHAFPPKSPIRKSNKIVFYPVSYAFLPRDFSFGLIKAGKDTHGNITWSRI